LSANVRASRIPFGTAAFDEDDWANHFRAYHLGEKLISLALRCAVFDGKPIFESKQHQRDAWAAGLPFFGLERREARARQGEALSEDQRKGREKTMAFRSGQAVRLSLEERFYFPCQVDHRGRVYPVPALMNPQSDHIGRALLEFADGKPLGNNRGVYWLAKVSVTSQWCMTATASTPATWTC